MGCSSSISERSPLLTETVPTDNTDTSGRKENENEDKMMTATDFERGIRFDEDVPTQEDNEAKQVASQQEDGDIILSTAKPTKVKSKTHGLDLEGVRHELDVRIDRLFQLEEYNDMVSRDDAEFIRESTVFSKLPDMKQAIAEYLENKNFAVLFKKVWNKHFDADLFTSENKCIVVVMKSIMVAMWNATDRSTALCKQTFKIHLEIDLFRYLSNEKLHFAETNSAQKIYIVKGLMGILHNLIQTIPAARGSFRECSAFTILQRLRDSKYSMIKCKANILLAHVIEENENDSINANDKNILFIVNMLQEALRNSDHRSSKSGFNAAELIIGLNKLAANDSNKIRIINNGALDSYVKLLQPDCTYREQSLAAQGIWILAFECSDLIKKNGVCLNALRHLVSTNEDADVTRMANGALSILDGRHTQAAQQTVARGTAQRHNSVEVRHVMISYQWDYQPVMLKVKKRLQDAGYAVWMDVEYMSGSILESMADAIENAAVVLIAMSQRYKESPNCRTEAEYTFRQRRDIVPLRVEPRYNPDGWLGALVGNRLFFDFSQEQFFEHSIINAIREIGQRGKKIANQEADFVDSPAVLVTSHPSTGAIPATDVNSGDTRVENWTSQDVLKWMNTNRLAAHTSTLADVDGPLLVELKDMLFSAPEFFYTTLSRQHSVTLLDLLRLSRALKKL